MKLGLTSAILPEMSLPELAQFLSRNGITAIEPMCWPPASGDRRKFAGVTHIDVTRLDQGEASRILDTLGEYGITISGLGYYPNPLAEEHGRVYTNHLKKVFSGAALLMDEPIVNTFIGRKKWKLINDNWPHARRIWRPLADSAGDYNVLVAIENCFMKFTKDEWPGGLNLAHSAANFRRLFEVIDRGNVGLNFDPSHLVLGMVSPAGVVRMIREFGKRIWHFHAKDMVLDQDAIDDLTVMCDEPKKIHHPRIPGDGQVPWAEVFAALVEVGYDYVVSIEVEDNREQYQSFEGRKQAVLDSAAFLRRFVEGPAAELPAGAAIIDEHDGDDEEFEPATEPAEAPSEPITT